MIITIRPAALEDYEEIIPLYNAFVSEERYTKKDNDSFEKVIQSNTNYMYVALDENRIIGFITFSTRNVVRYPKPILEIDELFVGISYRKHGVGRRLMEQMEEDARTLNCYRIFIESQYDHKGAHAFYESLGYKNYGYHFIKNV